MFIRESSSDPADENQITTQIKYYESYVTSYFFDVICGLGSVRTSSIDFGPPKEWKNTLRGQLYKNPAMSRHFIES